MSDTDTARIDALREIAAKDPGNALVHYAIANELLKAKRYEETIETLDVYLGMADDEGSAYRILAAAQVALGRAEAARDSYRKGIDAALRHHHPGMAAEFEAALDGLD